MNPLMSKSKKFIKIPKFQYHKNNVNYLSHIKLVNNKIYNSLKKKIKRKILKEDNLNNLNLDFNITDSILKIPQFINKPAFPQAYPHLE